MQRLSDAAVLTVIDELRASLPEFADVLIVRPWAISAIVAASAGVVTGHRSHRTLTDAARATAEATFHVKPLDFGNRVLAAMLAHVLLISNEEDTSFAETIELVGISRLR